MSVSSDKRDDLREHLDKLFKADGGDTRSVIMLCDYEQMSHSISYSQIKQAYINAGLDENKTPRENTVADTVNFGLSKFVSKFNSGQTRNNEIMRLRISRLKDGMTEDGRAVKTWALETFLKDSNTGKTKPTQINRIRFYKDSEKIAFEFEDYKEEMRSAIISQKGLVHPNIWKQSVRDFMDRNGAVAKKTGEGNSGGRWLPTQCLPEIRKLQKACREVGGFISILQIPNYSSKEDKGGIIDNVSHSLQLRLDAMTIQLNEASEKIRNKERIRSSQFGTVIAECKVIKKIAEMHGKNFGVSFTSINDNCKTIAERAGNLRDGAIESSEIAQTEAREAIVRTKKAVHEDQAAKVKEAANSAEIEGGFEWGDDDSEDEEEMEMEW